MKSRTFSQYFVKTAESEGITPFELFIDFLELMSPEEVAAYLDDTEDVHDNNRILIDFLARKLPEVQNQLHSLPRSF